MNHFLDNISLGPIRTSFADTTVWRCCGMFVLPSVVRGVGHEDRYDYPFEVFRELTVNALRIRDYGPGSSWHPSSVGDCSPADS